jgi:hypothetical protein
VIKFIFAFVILISFFANAENCPKPNTPTQKAIADDKEVHLNFCQPLKVGNSMIVNDPDDGVTSARYRLTKTSKNQYLAEVNPKIAVPATLAKDRSAADKIIKEYRNGISACLKNAAKYMIGPNGEKLEIKISEDSEIPKSEILISNEITRSHSEGYSSDINCATTVHETLHLLGLIDEYKEQSIGFIVDWDTGKAKKVENNAEVPGYGCRNLGPENSIMSNQYMAFQGVVPTKVTNYPVCECDSAEILCKKFISENTVKLTTMKDCPSGFRKATAMGFVPFSLSDATASFNMPNLFSKQIRFASARSMGGMLGTPGPTSFENASQDYSPSDDQPKVSFVLMGLSKEK